ncbi:MAG: DUF4468 domain-containing protein [Bacteroidetes bacterium]|nr:DUF4468 domain-containing protein [Bacteroidota bacterium]
MKSYSVSILLIFSMTISFGQRSLLPIDSISGYVSYTQIEKIDSVSANDLFNRAETWFAKTYNSSNDVVQKSDKENFTIIGKGQMKAHAQNFGARSWGYIKYTISIYCKEGRYKCVISDFIHEGDKFATASTYQPSVGLFTKTTPQATGMSGYRAKDFDRICQELNEKVTKLLSSLSSSMSKKLESKSDDW